jgi:hypothetical protein
MTKWVKNAIGLAFVVVILSVAKQVWFDRADTDVDVFQGHVRTSNAPQSRNHDNAIVRTTAVTQYRLPEHGYRVLGQDSDLDG